MLKYLALSAALLCGACASLTGSGSSDTATAAKKALVAAHVAHDALSVTASAAFKSGVCAGSCVTTVRTALDKSEKLLTDADGFSDPTNIMADVNAAIAILNDVKGKVQ